MSDAATAHTRPIFRAFAIVGALLTAGALAACTPPQGYDAEETSTAQATPEETATPTAATTDEDSAGSATADTTSDSEVETDDSDDSLQLEGAPESVTLVAGLPTGVSAPPDGVMAGVGWSSDASEIYVTTYGSSSCPVVAGSFEATPTTLTFELVQTGGAVCTDDRVATTATFRAPPQPASDSESTAIVGDLGEATVPAASDPISYGWVAPSDTEATE